MWHNEIKQNQTATIHAEKVALITALISDIWFADLRQVAWIVLYLSLSNIWLQPCSTTDEKQSQILIFDRLHTAWDPW